MRTGSITRNMAAIALVSLVGSAVYGRSTLQQPEKAAKISVRLAAKLDVWSEPTILSKRLGTLRAGDRMEVVGYHPSEDFFSIRHKNKIAYVDAAQVPRTKALDVLISESKARAVQDPGKTQGSRARIDNQAAKRQVLTQLYGERTAERIMQGKTWVGMTREMVIQSVGEPQSIKREVFSSIVKEHWKYANGPDLYFEDGILKAIGGPPPSGIQPSEPTVPPDADAVDWR
jgi:hypothetical protein